MIKNWQKEKNIKQPFKCRRKIFSLAERLRKKHAPGNLYKAFTENMPFFSRDRIFTIYKRAKLGREKQ